LSQWRFTRKRLKDEDWVVVMSSKMYTKTITTMKKEAQRLRSEFRTYLEDLELVANPHFWEAMEETKHGKGKKFKNVKEMLAELDR
jgi:cytochrome c556